MAAPRIAVLDPIACCAPVRSDSLDEDQAELLQQTLDEEQATDLQLTDLAVRLINIEAVSEDEDE